MRDFYLAWGSVAFAISGLVTFVVEYFMKDEQGLQKKYEGSGLGPGAARTKAEGKRKSERALFFLPWTAGFVVSAIGLFMHSAPVK